MHDKYLWTEQACKYCGSNYVRTSEEWVYGFYMPKEAEEKKQVKVYFCCYTCYKKAKALKDDLMRYRKSITSYERYIKNHLEMPEDTLKDLRAQHIDMYYQYCIDEQEMKGQEKKSRLAALDRVSRQIEKLNAMVEEHNKWLDWYSTQYQPTFG